MRGIVGGRLTRNTFLKRELNDRNREFLNIVNGKNREFIKIEIENCSIEK